VLDNYINYFKQSSIVAVVRLNDPMYDASVLTEAGIAHLDLPYFDGRPPSADIVNEFLKFVHCHSKDGAVAVHCRGGIGNLESIQFVIV
jgi:protein-tyrosine phosphatase